MVKRLAVRAAAVILVDTCCTSAAAWRFARNHRAVDVQVVIRPLLLLPCCSAYDLGVVPSTTCHHHLCLLLLLLVEVSARIERTHSHAYAAPSVRCRWALGIDTDGEGHDE